MLSSPNIKLTNWLVGSGHQSVVVFFCLFFWPIGSNWWSSFLQYFSALKEITSQTD